MLAAPIPADESERLAALRALLILDTPPEERFDKIVQFAATEFDVPVALISLLDSDRQWFKSAVGTEGVCETARDISFCGHVIVQPDIMVVPNALEDARFADNPLVLDGPRIRFYAGAPLAMPNGYTIGTLCIIDTQPRQLDALELSILSTLRDLVVLELVHPAEAPYA